MLFGFIYGIRINVHFSTSFGVRRLSVVFANRVNLDEWVSESLKLEKSEVKYVRISKDNASS